MLICEGLDVMRLADITADGWLFDGNRNEFTESATQIQKQRIMVFEIEEIWTKEE